MIKYRHIKDVDEYAVAIADFLEEEYGDLAKRSTLKPSDHKWIRQFIEHYYDKGECVGNASVGVLSLLDKMTYHNENPIE